MVTFVDVLSTGGKTGLRRKRLERMKKSRLSFGLQFETVVRCKGDVLKDLGNTRLKLKRAYR